MKLIVRFNKTSLCHAYEVTLISSVYGRITVVYIYIYIPTILSKTNLICMARGRFSGNRVLFGGLYLREKGARKAFGASVLHEFEFLTMHHLKKSRDGRITVVSSLYIPTILSKTNFICKARGRFPGNRVFFGGLYLQENGARKAFGAGVLNKFEFLTMQHLKKITMGG